jgi:hypothetical protein
LISFFLEAKKKQMLVYTVCSPLFSLMHTNAY